MIFLFFCLPVDPFLRRHCYCTTCSEHEPKTKQIVPTHWPTKSGKQITWKYCYGNVFRPARCRITILVIHNREYLKSMKLNESTHYSYATYGHENLNVQVKEWGEKQLLHHHWGVTDLESRHKNREKEEGETCSFKPHGTDFQFPTILARSHKFLLLFLLLSFSPSFHYYFVAFYKFYCLR